VLPFLCRSSFVARATACCFLPHRFPACTLPAVALRWLPRTWCTMHSYYFGEPVFALPPRIALPRSLHRTFTPLGSCTAHLISVHDYHCSSPFRVWCVRCWVILAPLPLPAHHTCAAALRRYRSPRIAVICISACCLPTQSARACAPRCCAVGLPLVSGWAVNTFTPVSHFTRTAHALPAVTSRLWRTLPYSSGVPLASLVICPSLVSPPSARFVWTAFTGCPSCGIQCRSTPTLRCRIQFRGSCLWVLLPVAGVCRTTAYFATCCFAHAARCSFIPPAFPARRALPGGWDCARAPFWLPLHAPATYTPLLPAWDARLVNGTCLPTPASRHTTRLLHALPG